jgi:hypothetical protein
MSKAKRRLKNFDFSGDNAAVALVHEMQGGAANGTKTLIMKATDVVVELSMAEFLMRFFNLWSGDAQMLARILGYSDDITSIYEYEYDDGEKFSDKVTLMKSLKDAFTGDSEVPDELKEIVQEMALKSHIKLTDGVSKTKPNGGNKETQPEVVKMADNAEMIEKSAVESLILDSVQKAVEKAIGEKDSKIVELEKSLEDFKTKEIEVQKATFVKKAKEFEVLGVEDFDKFGVALMKMAGDDSLKAVIDTLEKAVNIAKKAGEFEGEGHSLDADNVSGVEAILKAKGKIK